MSLFFEHYNRIFVTEYPDVTVLVWGRVYGTRHSHFTWRWSGLDSNS